ncbi:MAG: UDP-N-acetylmuramoyl-L-alanyl-D-glutamate--2,6-diaminopimelate ligase [Bacilli bacterium]|nr:UDP-N-acetylmuramoyl-L-alanyl-D-glutamate--2,6-diaminopimelate ligase [Bacilli bacterium]
MIQVDSRRIKQGDTFVALRGISSDGHSYIETAIKNGAIKVIAEEGSYSVETLIVKDTREYLTAYLKETYKDMLNDMTIIGVTGTNGKTTTAYLIYQALNLLGRKCSYIGTNGYFIGGEKIELPSLPNTTPDILEQYQMYEESYNKGYKYVVLEASSQAISYGRIEGIKFDYAIFTNLSEEHLNYHKTMENYYLAKRKLFEQLTGTAIINFDDDYKDKFTLEKNSNFFYGFNGGDIKVEDFITQKENTTFTYTYLNNQYKVNSNLIGKYNIYNMLATIALLINLKIDINDINKTISEIASPEGRMEKIIYNNNTIIIDYAHTPASIQSLIDTVNLIKHNNTYVVFGCAGERDRSLRSVMANIIMKNATKLIITSDDPHEEELAQIVNDMLEKKVTNNYEICLDRSLAIKKGISLLNQNDLLLILGKGHEKHMIIGKEKIPFSDKEEVNKYIEKENNSN